LLDAMGEFDNMEFKRMKERGDNETYDQIVARLKRLKDEREKNNEDDSEDEKEDNNEK
jgi:hypothetical protein